MGVKEKLKEINEILAPLGFYACEGAYLKGQYGPRTTRGYVTVGSSEYRYYTPIGCDGESRSYGISEAVAIKAKDLSYKNLVESEAFKKAVAAHEIAAAQWKAESGKPMTAFCQRVEKNGRSNGVTKEAA